MLIFLQSLFDKGRAFSTLKVYLAAISACHVGINGKTVGQHPLVCRFLRGARRLRPVSKPLSPGWDLPLVLGALSGPPFEPLSEVDAKTLSLKTALLMALVSAKRVGDLHALSVHSSCMQFGSGDSKVSLRPNPAYVPKVMDTSYSCLSMEFSAFHPPPFTSEEQRRLHTLCPVRALRAYVSRTLSFRKADQLFVSWSGPHKGKPITKQRLSRWVVEAIALAYSAKGLEAPVGLHAHSTRGVATSWALFKGVSLQEVCESASWDSPTTRVQRYPKISVWYVLRF